MKRRFIEYHEILMEDLQDQEFVNLYLNEALKDEDPRVFLLALKYVCKAQGKKMTLLAKQAKLSRENLYRILSTKGNPKFDNLIALLNAIGFEFSVTPLKDVCEAQCERTTSLANEAKLKKIIRSKKEYPELISLLNEAGFQISAKSARNY